MPAPAESDAGTASQLIAGVRRLAVERTNERSSGRPGVEAAHRLHVRDTASPPSELTAAYREAWLFNARCGKNKVSCQCSVPRLVSRGLCMKRRLHGQA